MKEPRYTDRYRKVMLLAQQEAHRFNHPMVDAHHLALALIREGGGVGAILLKNLDIDPRKVRLEIEKLILPEDEPVMREQPPLTKLAQAVVEIAYVEARETMGEDAHIGTEHLLLALVAVGETIPHRVLTSLGATHEKLHKELKSFLENPIKPDHSEIEGLLDELQKAYGTENHVDALAQALETYATLTLLKQSLDALKPGLPAKS